MDWVYLIQASSVFRWRRSVSNIFWSSFVLFFEFDDGLVVVRERSVVACTRNGRVGG